MTRIQETFAALKQQNKKVLIRYILISYIVAGGVYHDALIAA